MVNFYKEDSSNWRISDVIVGKHPCIICEDEKGNVVFESSVFPKLNFRLPISEIKDSSGTAYSSFEDLKTRISDFFINASSSGEAVLPNSDVSFYINEEHNLILNYPDTATDDYDINADGNLVFIY